MPDLRGDQASGLRRMLAGDHLRVVTFAAAAEGVGRSHVVANLASALARQGKTVLVVDENSAQDNIAGLFGTASGHDMLDVICGRLGLEAVLLEPEPGLRILPAARAVSTLGRLNRRQQDTLLAALGDSLAVPDVILVDADHNHPFGCSPFALASPETVVVLSASAAAITGAYALIKRFSLSYGRRHFRVLVNKVKSADEAARVFANLARVATQRGVATLDFAGHIPLDDALSQSSRCLRPVVSAFPDAPSALAFRGLAADLLFWPTDDEPGGLEHFMRQLLHLSQRITPNTIHAG